MLHVFWLGAGLNWKYTFFMELSPLFPEATLLCVLGWYLYGQYQGITLSLGCYSIQPERSTRKRSKDKKSPRAVFIPWALCKLGHCRSVSSLNKSITLWGATLNRVLSLGTANKLPYFPFRARAVKTPKGAFLLLFGGSRLLISSTLPTSLRIVPLFNFP